MEIETHFLDLNNSTTITPNKGSFCNKGMIQQQVQKEKLKIVG